jgi:hypothetical protein
MQQGDKNDRETKDNREKYNAVKMTDRLRGVERQDGKKDGDSSDECRPRGIRVTLLGVLDVFKVKSLIFQESPKLAKISRRNL